MDSKIDRQVDKNMNRKIASQTWDGQLEKLNRQINEFKIVDFPG